MYDVIKVPLKRGTPELLAKYGTIVDDYEQEKVIIRQWPQEGKRPILDGNVDLLFDVNRTSLCFIFRR